MFAVYIPLISASCKFTYIFGKKKANFSISITIVAIYCTLMICRSADRCQYSCPDTENELNQFDCPHDVLIRLFYAFLCRRCCVFSRSFQSVNFSWVSIIIQDGLSNNNFTFQCVVSLKLLCKCVRVCLKPFKDRKCWFSVIQVTLNWMVKWAACLLEDLGFSSELRSSVGEEYANFFKKKKKA